MKLTEEQWRGLSETIGVGVDFSSPAFGQIVNVPWVEGLDPFGIPSVDELAKNIFGSLYSPGPNQRDRTRLAGRALDYLSSLTPQFAFRRELPGWLIVFKGKEARFRDLAGLECIHRLLEQEGKDVSCNVLLALSRHEGANPCPLSTEQRQDILRNFRQDFREGKDEALRGVDRKVIEEHLTNCLEALESTHDQEIKIELEEEIKKLKEYLKANPENRKLQSTAEANRKKVFRNIDTAFRAIRTKLRPAAAHLRASIKTGHLCRYNPDPLEIIRWTLQ